MGSLLLAGAAEGLGKGIVSNVARRNELEQRDLDRKHDIALQKMRDQSAGSRQEAGFEHQRSLYEMEREDTLSDAEIASQREREMMMLERGFDVTDREDKQEHEVFVEAMKLFQETTESGKAVKSADGKWEMKVLTDTVTGPNGIPVEQDRFVVREPGSPLVLEQFDRFMLPNGQTDEERATSLTLARSGELREAEQDLLKKAGTDNDDSSEFLEAYGYLPVSYYRKVNQQARGESGFQSFYLRFRAPAGIPEVEPRASLEDTDPEPRRRGALSEAAEAAGEQSPTHSPPTNASPKGYKPEDRRVPITRREPNVQLDTIPEPSAVETLANPDRAFQGARDAATFVTEKPWITNPVMRHKMGLSLTPEQAAEVAEFIGAEMKAQR